MIDARVRVRVRLLAHTNSQNAATSPESLRAPRPLLTTPSPASPSRVAVSPASPSSPAVYVDQAKLTTREGEAGEAGELGLVVDGQPSPSCVAVSPGASPARVAQGVSSEEDAPPCASLELYANSAASESDSATSDADSTASCGDFSHYPGSHLAYPLTVGPLFTTLCISA